MSTNAHPGFDPVAEESLRMEEEIVAVGELLQEAIVALYAPLNDLAQSQIKKAVPYHCAAVVLAAGVSSTDSALLRQQRIYLAAALEMLNIALAIHQLLLVGVNQEDDGEENPNQRSVTGSVILTGDFCFTQSAILAAKTDNVRVVEIFSETLKTVSEGILRQIFADRDAQAANARGEAGEEEHAPFQILLSLCEAGVEGTAALLPASPAALQATKQLVHALVPQWHQPQSPQAVAALSADQLSALEMLPTAQQQRWHYIFR